MWLFWWHFYEILVLKCATSVHCGSSSSRKTLHNYLKELVVKRESNLSPEWVLGFGSFSRRSKSLLLPIQYLLYSIAIAKIPQKICIHRIDCQLPLSHWLHLPIFNCSFYSLIKLGANPCSPGIEEGGCLPTLKLLWTIIYVIILHF